MKKSSQKLLNSEMLTKLLCLALLAFNIVNCCLSTNSTTDLSDKLIDESVSIKSEVIDLSSSSVNEISINNNKLNQTEKLIISNGRYFFLLKILLLIKYEIE